MEDYAGGKIQLKFGDALELNEEWIPPQWKECVNPIQKLQIIGNLPFAVATPLTLNLIKEFSLGSQGLFRHFNDIEMIFLFQNEVAHVSKTDLFNFYINIHLNLFKKFSAKIGTRNYGRLAIMSQTFCDVTYSFPIQSIKFTPRPKVDSGLVKFQFKPLNKLSDIMSTKNLFNDLESLTRKIFRHKNKKLDSVQLPWSELGIDTNLRPHHLSPENLIKILRKI